MVTLGLDGSSSGAFSVKRPSHQQHGHQNGGDKLDPQQVGPSVDFALPLWVPRLRLAIRGLGQRRIGFQLLNQRVVGDRLPERVPDIERHQEQQPTMGTLSGVEITSQS